MPGNKALKIDAETGIKGAGGSSQGFYATETYQPEGTLGFLAGRCLNKISDALDLILKDKGLNSELFGLLHAIYRGKANTPSGLAQLRYRQNATITYMLNVLEKRGLLTRVPNTRDRRAIELRLTREGKAVVSECIPLVVAAQNKVLAPLTAEEYGVLSGLLRKLAYETASPDSTATP